MSADNSPAAKSPHEAYNAAMRELEALSMDLRGLAITNEAREQARLRLEVAQAYTSLGDSLLTVIAVHKQRDESQL